MASKSGADALKSIKFFKGMPDLLLCHLSRAGKRRTLQQDEVLFTEGQPRELLAVVLSGEIAIERTQDGETVLISSLGAGEVVGEALLLEEPNHGTSGRATQPTEVLCFEKAPLIKLLKDQPQLYAALLSRTARTMNERIKLANAAIIAGRTGTFKVREK
jgi:aspartate ammonia-lyase